MPSAKPLFQLTSTFTPQGDQPRAIAGLVQGLQNAENKKYTQEKQSDSHVLLGVTGSGKTFTMAHVIQATNRPALILAPNKTLAAQLYAEMKDFFPSNAVEYFVSYYDYYQPEAYVPRTGTYIEKEATINEQIDRMRHSATRSLLERRDVIVVASVSCIYGIGSPTSYASMTLGLHKNMPFDRSVVLRRLVDLQYKRNDMAFVRGTFRVKGDVLDIFPSHYESRAWRIMTFDDVIESITEIDPLTNQKGPSLDKIVVYPNSHYVVSGPTLTQAIGHIKNDLKTRLAELESHNKLVEAQRLRERITFDIESMTAMGTCPGIENYSRYLTGRPPGSPPPTLFEYLPNDALLIVDESHVAIPQLRAMYKGDASRKKTLSEYGFRLPSCADNRPLKFEEWHTMRPSTIYVSATPADFELEETAGVVHEQVIRPTGLLDPVCEVRPTENQIDDLMHTMRKVIAKGGRILVTTLTKKMAETLQEYLVEVGLKSAYIHADVDTLERIELIKNLRLGVVDILVGINLLREGLDIPECALVAILDADKEGYLRSHTSLIQTMGRAARHAEGRVILYADKITRSMQLALDETKRRRDKQELHNKVNNITPQTVKRAIEDIVGDLQKTDSAKNKHPSRDSKTTPFTSEKAKKKHLQNVQKRMLQAAERLDFEEAARLRDEVAKLQMTDLLV